MELFEQNGTAVGGPRGKPRAAGHQRDPTRPGDADSGSGQRSERAPGRTEPLSEYDIDHYTFVESYWIHL